MTIAKRLGLGSVLGAQDEEDDPTPAAQVGGAKSGV